MVCASKCPSFLLFSCCSFSYIIAAIREKNEAFPAQELPQTRLNALSMGLGPESCPFLEVLPFEVRKMIYELLLSRDEVIDPYRSKNLHTPHCLGGDYQWPGTQSKKAAFRGFPRAESFSLFILETCHQINKEATKVLYGSNTFLFYASCDFELPSSSFFKTISRTLCGEYQDTSTLGIIQGYEVSTNVKKWIIVIDALHCHSHRSEALDSASRFVKVVMNYFCCVALLLLPFSIETHMHSNLKEIGIVTSVYKPLGILRGTESIIASCMRMKSLSVDYHPY